MQNPAELMSQQLKKLRKSEHLISTFNQTMEHRKNLEIFQLFSNISNNSKIIYVDPDKQYGIVHVKYIDQLKQKIKANEQALVKFSNKVKDQHLNKELFNRIVDSRENQINKLNLHIIMLENKISEFQRVIRNNQQVLDEKEIQFNLLVQKYERHIAIIKNENTDKFMNKYMLKKRNCHQEVQTQFEINRKYDQDIEGEPSENAVDRIGFLRKKTKKTHDEALSEIYEQQIKQLKQNFAQAFEEMTRKTQQKMQQLQDQRLGIKEWIAANEKLKAQNNELREQIRITNEQQFKLKTWKNSLENCIENIEKEHKLKEQKFNIFNASLNSEAAAAPTGEFMAEEKIKLLQVTIDKLQLEQRESKRKLEEVRTILEQSTDISNVSEENIVGTLFGLSCKIKEVIKFLLQDI